MGGLKRGAYLSHMLTSTVGHWGLCFTGFFFQGPGCRAATTVMWKRGEPQRASWLDESSLARQLPSTHSPLAGASFWPHAITRGQRFQFSSCRGEDKQIPAGSTRDDHRAMGSSGPEPSCAGEEMQPEQNGSATSLRCLAQLSCEEQRRHRSWASPVHSASPTHPYVN